MAVSLKVPRMIQAGKITGLSEAYVQTGCIKVDITILV